MNNACTISCVDSMAILFMFYLKIFLGCCNDKTGSALTQKQAAYLPQIPKGGSAKGRIDQATISLALRGRDTGAFEVFSAFSGALSQGVQFSDKADQGKEYECTEDRIDVVHRGFRLLH